MAQPSAVRLVETYEPDIYVGLLNCFCDCLAIRVTVYGADWHNV